MSFMGLDIGTTGCKALVISESGKLITRAYAGYHLLHRGPGLSELDPDEVWRAACSVIREAASAASNAGDPVVAIAPSVLGEAVTPIDESGSPLSFSTTSADMRGADEIQQVGTMIGAERLFQITGHSSHPMFTLAKLLYWRRAEPDLYRRAQKFLCWEDMFFYRLCGRCVIDYSLASRTLLFDINRKTWSDEMLSASHIEREVLSETVPSGHLVGYVEKEINKELELGLPEHCALVAGGWDQGCAALGAGVIEEGVALDNTGTTECIAVVAKGSSISPRLRQGHYQVVPHVVPDLYLISGGSLVGGMLLQWYRDTLGGYEVEQAARQGIDPYDVILGQLSPAPSPVLVLPYFAGAGTPVFNPNAKGVFWGLTLTTTREDIIKGLIDGLGYELRQNIEFIKGCGIAVDRLHVVGGASRSGFWVQQKCNVTGCTAFVPGISDASALGAALLAGHGIGAFDSYNTIISKIMDHATEKKPDPPIYQLYTRSYALYHELVSSAIAMLGE
ncbi:MAG TPA: hypothetical protein GXX51_07540 [Firmicutes bacterium]|nr:hypothetical protein [Bacillota bacterium]